MVSVLAAAKKTTVHYWLKQGCPDWPHAHPTLLYTYICPPCTAPPARKKQSSLRHPLYPTEHLS